MVPKRELEKNTINTLYLTGLKSQQAIPSCPFNVDVLVVYVRFMNNNFENLKLLYQS